MNAPKLSLDSLAAVTVIAAGLFATGAGALESGAPTAPQAVAGTTYSVTHDGRLKVTVTAERGGAPEAWAARSAAHVAPARS